MCVWWFIYFLKYLTYYYTNLKYTSWFDTVKYCHILATVAMALVCDLCLCVLSKIITDKTNVEDLPPCFFFFSRSFMVIRPLIHSEWIFLSGIRYGCNSFSFFHFFIFCMWLSSFPSKICERYYPFPKGVFGSIVGYQLTVYVEI